jgi:phage-related protein
MVFARPARDPSAYTRQQKTLVSSLPTPLLACHIRHIFLMSPNDKPLVWLAGDVKTPPFSAEARLEAGFLLRKLQRGDVLAMPSSRPMPSVGPGCHELRIVDRDVTWRIMYFVDEDAVVILAVFKKKTRATPRRVVAACRNRLQRYRSLREEE